MTAITPEVLAIARDQAISTPFVLLHEDRIVANYARVHAAFHGRVEVCFATKSNSDPIVLQALAAEGSSFEIASAGELERLRSLEVEGSRVTFSAPVKAPGDIAYAYLHGVRRFVFDSDDEIEKLAEYAPGSTLMIRLAVDNAGSGWPLADKFGVDEDEALRLLIKAQSHGLAAVGATFHVGSQCENLANWRAAISRCASLWNRARDAGVNMTVLDLGGGLPAPYKVDVPSVEEIGAAALAALAELVPTATTLMLEPGRYIVADAGVVVGSVIGTARRGAHKLVYLDVGLFNGLMEAYEVFWYPLQPITKETRPAETMTLVGPTCDSVDVIVKHIELPGLIMGDRIIFDVAGAYTNSYESYNGFAYPKVHAMERLQARRLHIRSLRPEAPRGWPRQTLPSIGPNQPA